MFDYCILEKVQKTPLGGTGYKVIDMIVHCNNLVDRLTIEEGLQKARSFRRMREELGYAGKFKKISGEKHDGIYCTDQSDAVQVNLGLQDGHSIEKIMGELGYTKYGWDQVAHGYAIQKLWHNDAYETVITPSILISSANNSTAAPPYPPPT